MDQGITCDGSISSSCGSGTIIGAIIEVDIHHDLASWPWGAVGRGLCVSTVSVCQLTLRLRLSELTHILRGAFFTAGLAAHKRMALALRRKRRPMQGFIFTHGVDFVDILS